MLLDLLANHLIDKCVPLLVKPVGDKFLQIIGGDLFEDLLLDLAVHRNLFERYDIVHSVALVRMAFMHVPLGIRVEIAFEHTHAKKVTELLILIHL